VLCPSCGYRNASDHIFCGNCGTSLKARFEVKSNPSKTSVERQAIRATEAPATGRKNGGPLPLFESRKRPEGNNFQESRNEPSKDFLSPQEGVEQGRYQTMGSSSPSSAVPKAQHETQREAHPNRLNEAQPRIHVGSRGQQVLLARDADIDREPQSGFESSSFGTSVLGLEASAGYANSQAGSSPSDSGTAAFDLSYLYDEKPGRAANWRAISALLVLVLFAGFLVYVWRQYPSWNSMIIRPPKEQAKLLAHKFAGIAGIERSSASNPEQPARAGSQPANSAQQNSAIPSDDQSGKGSLEKEPATVEGGSGQNLKNNTNIGDVESGKSSAGSGPSSGVAAPKSKANMPPEREASPQVAVIGNEQDSAGAVKPAAKDIRTPVSDPGEEQYRQGMAFLGGRGNRNCGQAVMLLNSAAAKGNSKAASQLGAMYATGHCVILDRPTAYRWFGSALAEHHSPLTERNRQMLWSQMSDSERQRALGMR
jgi:hypothetical protein